VFTNDRRSANVDLIRAEMFVKAHNVFNQEAREVREERARRILARP
jgi:hypothetical protein